jgi:hypothetical protein
MSLHVLNNVTGNAECVDDISANNVLVNLFQPLYTSLIQSTVLEGLGAHEYQPTLCLSILHSLMGDTRLVKECINYSEFQNSISNNIKTRQSLNKQIIYVNFD